MICMMDDIDVRAVKAVVVVIVVMVVLLLMGGCHLQVANRSNYNKFTDGVNVGNVDSQSVIEVDSAGVDGGISKDSLDRMRVNLKVK